MSTTLVDLGLPASRAMLPAGMATAPSSCSRSCTPWGICAAPILTGTGSICSSLTKSAPPSLRNCWLRRASTASKETTTSAQPSSAIMVWTSRPMLTTVWTLPPRCDMPWISEILTS